MVEYIFINGTILTMDNNQPGAEAILVRDNLIIKTGGKKSVYAAAKTFPTVIDLKGKILLPAFTDTHTHFVEYAKRRLLVDLSACRTMAEIKNQITKYIDDYGDKVAWISGSGWDKNNLDHPECITGKWLDEICAERPMVFQSKDYHTKWCNSKALQLANISPVTSVPAGGVIGIDDNGALTGLLYDEAAPLPDKYIELPPVYLQIKAIREAISEAWKLGLCGAHLMETEANWDMATKAATPVTPFRLVWHFPYSMLDTMIGKGIRSYSGNEDVKIGGAKIFTDGALGSQSAYMYENYPDTENHGLMRFSETELIQMIGKAARHGIACTIHAIGDKANHQVVNAFYANKKLSQNLLQRIEHVQCIRESDLNRLRECDIYAALQPIHLANDIPLIELYWQTCSAQTYQFRTMINKGIYYGFGSDVPVEQINPFLGIYTATNRKPQFLPEADSWQAEQCLNLEQALFGYTYGAAMGSCSEYYRGSITDGKLADLIVVDDFQKEKAEFWLSANSRLTMVGGLIVHNELSF